MFEIVDGRTDGWTTDGRRMHWYTISSPMSLWVRTYLQFYAENFWTSKPVIIITILRTKFLLSGPIILRPQGYKTFFMLNSAEHKIYPAHKC